MTTAPVNKLRVVLDTNVYFSAFTHQGAPFRIWQKAALCPKITLQVIAEDPTDDRILECAVAGRADLIVSGDRHLRKLKSFREIGIVQPSDFLRTLE
jgi:predicted nucleic acid-binding protein